MILVPLIVIPLCFFLNFLCSKIGDHAALITMRIITREKQSCPLMPPDTLNEAQNILRDSVDDEYRTYDWFSFLWMLIMTFFIYSLSGFLFITLLGISKGQEFQSFYFPGAITFGGISCIFQALDSLSGLKKMKKSDQEILNGTWFRTHDEDQIFEKAEEHVAAYNYYLNKKYKRRKKYR